MNVTQILKKLIELETDETIQMHSDDCRRHLSTHENCTECKNERLCRFFSTISLDLFNNMVHERNIDEFLEKVSEKCNLYKQGINVLADEEGF